MCLGGVNGRNPYKKPLIEAPSLNHTLTYFLSQKEYTSSPQLAAKRVMMSG